MRQDASTQPGWDRATVAAVGDFLLEAMAAAQRPPCIGVSGLQGSGKTRLAGQLRRALARRGVRVQVLSLDDFYLGRRERAELARTLHPLFATRGVPGTHDTDLLRHALDALPRVRPVQPLALPRFDKGRDTRRPPSHWRRVSTPPDLIVLEGWCVGVPAQARAALMQPINALERDEDAEGRWRRAVNAALAGPYARLWRRLEHLIVLAAPNFEVVARWRTEQEQALRARHAPRALDDAALRRFLMHYERLSRHALASLPERADLCLELGPAREVRALRRGPRFRP